MKHLFLSLFLILLTIGHGIRPTLAEDTIDIISPLNRVWVDGKVINLVYRIEADSFDAITVTVDYSSDQVYPGIRTEDGIQHNSLFLTEGENRISIQVLKDEKVTAEKSITVFLRSSLMAEYAAPPSGFEKYTFHTSHNEIHCRLCHAEELRQGSKSQQDGELPSCYTCHKRIVDKKYVHGPASVWACTTCHNTNSTGDKNEVPDPEVTVCRMCHADELAAWQNEKFGHGPTMAGKCVLCHNPHAANEDFFLRKSTSDLCGFCHQDKWAKPHVVSDFFKQGHPVKKVKGRDGKQDISCASCHNPHAANNVNLLIGFEKSNTDLCRRCHITQPGK
jgi:predicted CXXCH cytochrome family protein